MNRQLPANISAHPDGYTIRLQRGPLKYRAFVSSSRPDPLGEAVKLRDQFLQIAGPALRWSNKAQSNTGIPGIYESVKWVRNEPIDCFAVYLGLHHQPRLKRIYYGSFRSRKVALRKAIALRVAIGATIPQLPESEAFHG